MTEQEQIEKWRKEFEKFIVKAFEVSNPTAEKRRDSGEYFYAHVQLAWLAWCEAKRTQTNVDMTLGQVVVLNDFDRGYNQAISDACIRLAAAGIKYTIEGEKCE